MNGPVEESVFSKGWESYKAACSKRGLKTIRAVFNAGEGIAICETEANSEADVKAAHEEIAMLPTEIIEVKIAQ